MGGSSGAASGGAPGGMGTFIPASSPGSMASRNVLSRTSQALAAVQAMQNAARGLAWAGPNHLINGANDVPNGLGVGGLMPDTGLVPDPNNPGSYILSNSTWKGVASLSQSASSSPNPTGDSDPSSPVTVTVTQNAQQAIVNWTTFNIGKNTTLNFDQSAGGTNVANWIAFNQISSTGVPSQILGRINTLGPAMTPGSGGQVYVINPNGIIFGGSSQVNARSLVAASLPINTNLLNNGLLNNPDSQFLFSALPVPIGAVDQTPAFNPPAIQGVYGDVEVQPGATLTAVPTSANVGGLVALIGPNVYNGGTLSTQYGQTVLAAGLQVGLASHYSIDPSLRGLDVYVGAVSPSEMTPAQAALSTLPANQPAAGTAENADINPANPTGQILAMGDIETAYGDAMMVGSNVNQLGIINSLTSVSYNGRVDLLADYDAISITTTNPTTNSKTTYLNPTATGSVVLGPGSVTQILPDMSGQMVVGTQLALPSIVDIEGQSIQLATDATGNGAMILAPGATVPIILQPNAATPIAAAYVFGADTNGSALSPELTAGVTLNAGNWSGSASSGYNFENNTSGTIELDSGATIDVSGSQNVSASVDENIVPVQLLGAQLANSPLQRNGPLDRQTVDVDIMQIGNYNGLEWAGTPLADTTGFINLIQRSVGELTTNGGTVVLNAGDSVTMNPNSTINVSASAINYTGGVVSTTKVISNGQILDISQATPDLVYSGIYSGTYTTTDAKWGVSQTYANPLFVGGGQYEQGYTQWGNAGSVAITAPAMTLNGNFFGNTSEGQYQRTPLSQVVNEFDSTSILYTMEPILGVPTAGTLSLNFAGMSASGTESTLVAPATSTNVYIQSGGSQASDDPPPLLTDIVLSADLVNSGAADFAGFGNLTVYDPTGNIYVPDNVTTPAGGGINLTGQNIKIDGQVSAPSGTLSFTVDGVSPFVGNNTTTPSNVPAGFGQFTLDQGASLSTAGLIVDDRAAAAAPGTLPLFTDGGTIAVNAYQIDLQPQSTVDVSGGVEMTAANKLIYGAGGALTLNAEEPTARDSGLLPGTTNYGYLVQDATFLGYSGKAGSGGTLSLTAPFVQVGGNQLLNGDAISSGRTLWLNETDASGNLLQPDFFDQGGFSNFSLSGLGDFALDATGKVIPFTYMPAVVIAPDTVIDPQVSSSMATTPVGGGLALNPTLLQVGLRTPASLTFNSLGESANFAQSDVNNNEGLRGDLVIYPGAIIQTDPLGSVTMNQSKNKGVTVTNTGDTVTIMGSVQNPNGSITPGAQIIVPGGTISITGALTSDETSVPLFAQPSMPTVDLGPGSVLNANGTTVLTPNPRGYTTGTVLPGGSISIAGNIVIEAGAELNVNGTSSGQLEALQAETGVSTVQSGAISGSKYVPVQEESNGGSIILAGQDELFIDPNASLSGIAGGSMAQGGSLTVSSSYYTGGAALSPTQVTLFLNQNGTPFYVAGQTAPGQTVPVAGSSLIVSGPLGSVPGGPPIVIGNQVVGSNGAPLPEGGYFGASSLNAGGFASLTLGQIQPSSDESSGSHGTVQFSGRVSLTASNSLTIGVTGVLLADPNPNTTSSLTLNAPYVELGQPFLVPGQPQSPINNSVPTYGSGRLTVNASDLIDVGTLSLQNICSASFDATVNLATGQSGVNNGAIRGDGTLDVAGAITMTAGQIYPPTATTFNIAAYDYSTGSGSVTILRGPGLPPLPLSAGGTLNVYATTINQGGVLRAPFGSINLGGAGSSSDPVSGNPFPSTQALMLAPASITSVSAVDPVNGQALTIPYGIILNGTSWIDPTGTDITATGNGVAGAGLPYGNIHLNAANVTTDTGATIDLTGGGDLYAYRWVPGLGGEDDILNSTYNAHTASYSLTANSPLSAMSFAIIPSYSADYAPIASYNPASSNFSTPNPTNPISTTSPPSTPVNPGEPSDIIDYGYTNPALSVGDKVYLGASNGLPAGYYTLLPARYALLPGAFLITPQSSVPVGTGSVSRADGSSLVPGYQSNDLRPTQPLLSSFEVDPQSVVLARAEYDPSTANSFFSQSAQTQHIATPRLPVDAGQLVFNVAASLPNETTSLNIQPGIIVDGTSIAGGLGGLIDISSPENIFIEPNGASSPGSLVLDPSELDLFGAESLLVGGIRQSTTSGMTATVSTNNLTVANSSGAPLTGSDIILAANNTLTVAPGAVVSAQNEPFAPAQTLQVGQTIVLSGSQSSFTVARAGTAIGFPSGGTISVQGASTTTVGTITSSTGVATTLTGGSNAIPVGSTVTLNNAGVTITASGTVPIVIGDGTLLRVSSDPSASIARAGVTGSTTPVMTIGAGAKIAGGSVTLDSTGTTLLDSIPSGTAINLDSGRVSLQLGTSGSPQGLVLSNGALQALESSTSSLSLLSYSSIDIYGSGNGVDSVGALDANGQPTFTSLALHAGEIDDATNGSNDAVQFNAQNIVLDNNASGIDLDSGLTNLPTGGGLTFNAATIELGANQLDIHKYSTVTLSTTSGITVQGTAVLATQGALNLWTPSLTGASGANETIAAGGSLSITNPGQSPLPVAVANWETNGVANGLGLGVNLTLVGAQNGITNTTTNDGVAIGSDVALPSGTLNVDADNGNLSVYAGGMLNVSGVAQPIFGATQYTSGGQITLKSDAGKINLMSGSTVNVSAQPQAGNAGSLTISAPTGTFINNGTLSGQGGVGGQGGTFSLDVGSLSDLASLDAALNPVFNPSVSNTVLGGFTQSQSIRVRTGPVAVDGTAAAQAFNLSADQGDITVTGTGKIVATAAQNGTIDVNTDSANHLINPGVTGGAINLVASGNVTLSSGSLLTVAGQNFNAAGKGGAVSLTAGAYEVVNNAGTVNTAAVVNIAPTSTIDLSVENNIPYSSSSAAANTPVNLNGTNFIIATDPTSTTGAQIGTIYYNSANNNPPTQSPLYDNDLTAVNGASYVTMNNGGTVAFPGSTTLGDYTGTLLLSESQPAFGNGTALISSLGSNIKNASSIVLAGLQVFDLSGASSTNPAITPISSSGQITVAVENAVKGNGTGFVSPVYASNQGFLQNNPDVNIEPSTEIVNENINDTSAGALTLASTWDLSTDRFGPNSTPGILTLRAAGNLVFDSGGSASASLTDGFGPTPTPINTKGGLWQAPLLPAGSQSWSYNLVAGADFSAVDLQRVVTGVGSLKLGLGYGSTPLTTGGNSSDAATIEKYYQVIRTGTGNINIFAGQDVQLLNPLATIYTAGSQAPALPTDEFVVPSTTYSSVSGEITAPNTLAAYPAQYSQSGGNVTISAQHDIISELLNPSTNTTTPESSAELPTNWLYRRGYVNPATGAFALTHTSLGTAKTGNKEIASTSWWIDFSNFFEGVGALGGGNVTLLAGNNVTNVDAVAPTNARVTYQLPNSNGTFAANADNTTGTYDQIAADQTLVELGGGNVVVNTGNNINGGVYYVERGSGTLSAGNQILTNSTRSTVSQTLISTGEYLNPLTWLPTTLFLGQGSFDVTAGGSVLLGPVANPFLLPQGIDNSYFDKTYFSTYATTDAVDVSSLTGNVTVQDNPNSAGGAGGSLLEWYGQVLNQNYSGSLAKTQPWLGLVEYAPLALPTYFTTAVALMPGTLQATAFSGSLNLVGNLTLSPSPTGTINLAAAESINGLQPNSLQSVTLPSGVQVFESAWDSSTINLSDANPNSLPGIYNPLSLKATTTSTTIPQASTQALEWVNPPTSWITNYNGYLAGFFAPFLTESGATNDALQAQQELHGTSVSNITGLAGPLHVNDANPVELYAAKDDISGITLYAGKAAQVVAGSDISDIALYLQNDNPGDVSVVDAGRDIIAYDPNAPLLKAATTSGNELLTNSDPDAGDGDIQIGGPGTLEVLAGRNFDLGVGGTNTLNNGTAVGITSIGNASNPALPLTGADVVAGAGFGRPATGLDATTSQLNFTAFIDQFLTPTSSYWSSLLPELQTLIPSPISVTGSNVDFSAGLPAVWPELTESEQKLLAPQILNTFYLVLRDAGRNHNVPTSPGFGNYNTGFAAIADLFPTNDPWQGDITLTSREIKTENGGNIDIFAPGGQLTVGLPVSTGQPANQGILTDDGGNISIFTNGNVTVGVSRIFTLRGGNEIIWSSTGNIAAGAASKTVQAAPPTRVIVNPTSASVETDLAGLATGGGIGVLATVAGVAPGDVDLIAPGGTIDAGDAGIRASGNLNISAVTVLNASNIQVGGKSTGVSAPPAAPNIGSIASASNTSAASSNAAAEVAKQGHAPVQQAAFPSIITVEVLGYGGGDS